MRPRKDGLIRQTIKSSIYTKSLPLNTGDCLIEMAAWAVFTWISPFGRRCILLNPISIP